MKNIFKFLFVSILGFVLVACGGPKNDYKLEGKYSMKKVEYVDGNEIFKSNSNVEITRKGNVYTLKGSQFETSRNYRRDFITKEIIFDDWKENTNNNFTFSGKIVKEASENSKDPILNSNKLYVWDLDDGNGNIVSIMLYKDSKVKNAIESEVTHFNDLKGAIYNGEAINDVINLNSNNDSIIEYNLTAIRDN